MENHRPVNHQLSPPASATGDQEILDNIDGRMHGPMSGFINKYFGNFQYVHQNGVLEIQAVERLIGRYSVPLAAPSPDDFLQWFSNYVSPGVDGARGSWHISRDHVASEDETADGGASLLLTIPVSSAPTWDRIQVIGQFCHSGRVCYRDGLLRLCRSAYQVFASQPTRLFLHGFYIRSSLIELWVFDRSGLYCSDVFDIRRDVLQFLGIILSYQRMSDQDLGKINIIETDMNGIYVTLDNAALFSSGKLYLDSQLIASRECLVGTGTTCYRARMPNSNRWDNVLKFKWRWARDRPEDELLKLAEKKHVWGAVSLDYYKEVESTANLRRGFRWGVQRRFSRKAFHQIHENTEDQQQKVTYNAEGLAAYTEETENFFQNRILACIVTSPVGRPLHTFKSILELLQVFRDAIKCHRSLFYDAKILHQDISSGNIIILDEQDGGKPKGILIDLDSAIELSEELEMDSGITGTRPFMAIGVLKGESHTYRHDLESFLYVFLWTIITNRADNPTEASKLRQWSNGDWDELAARKTLDMTQDGFQRIMEEFTSAFYGLKPLAERLRQILFPLQDGEIWIGTDSSPGAIDELYSRIIQAFEEVIEEEHNKEQGTKPAY
ncbi:hypothetical protein K449DRAFT_389540 [Hypoxylon sp. EC38]|nr:hypothetical protein K449DRAFT_389540 [Hypoxylon sp. EC38]